MTTTVSSDIGDGFGDVITGPDDELKAKHRAMWALGDYASVAADMIPHLGARLVDACGVRSGQRVLDVAAGTGNAAIPAALTGAHVVACDLTPGVARGRPVDRAAARRAGDLATGRRRGAAVRRR